MVRKFYDKKNNLVAEVKIARGVSYDDAVYATLTALSAGEFHKHFSKVVIEGKQKRYVVNVNVNVTEEKA